jgi:hypothetical protein
MIKYFVLEKTTGRILVRGRSISLALQIVHLFEHQHTDG